jgi:hypothetical protein
MQWVNFNFKYLTGFFKFCFVELEVEMYSTLVTVVGFLILTFVVRGVINTFLVPWWIRRKVSAVCMLA